MKTALSAVALFSLLLAAGAGSPAAATESNHREAPTGATVWDQNQVAHSQDKRRYDDDDDDDWRRYQPWPNQGNNWNNGWNNNWNNGWNNGWNNNWQQVQGRPLPQHVVVFKLKQQNFYNVQKIKLKKGYYRIYAYDRWRRPVEVIMNPYTGRILRVGLR